MSCGQNPCVGYEGTTAVVAVWSLRNIKGHLEGVKMGLSCLSSHHEGYVVRVYILPRCEVWIFEIILLLPVLIRKVRKMSKNIHKSKRFNIKRPLNR